MEVQELDAAAEGPAPPPAATGSSGPSPTPADGTEEMAADGAAVAGE